MSTIKDDDSTVLDEDNLEETSSDSDDSTADLKAQIAKLTDIAARSQADLQNYKDRAKREEEELRKFATVPLIMELIHIRDDVVRAEEHEKDQHDSFVTTMLVKIDKVLDGVGVTKIQALGQTIDPTQHEVLNTALGEKDVILAIHQDGFLLHGRVLRPCKVQVGDGSS